MIGPTLVVRADTLLIIEGFQNTNYSSRIVPGANPAIAGFTGAWQGSSSTSLQIGTSGLSLAGYSTLPDNTTVVAGNRRIYVDANTRMGRRLYTGADGPLANFTAGSGHLHTSADGRSIYLAFLARTTSAGATPSSGSFSLFDGGVETSQRTFRIAWLDSTVTAVTGASEATLGGRTSMVELYVVGITFADGADQIRIWRNPTTGGAEPAATAEISGDLAFDYVGMTFSGSGSLELDELRIGDSWTAVTDASYLAGYTPPAPTPDPMAVSAPDPSKDGMEVFPASDRYDGKYPADFFPFIDRFGQYVHLDWADKIRDEADLTQRFQAELGEIDAIQPTGRDAYGGWKNGPRLEATGFFRTQEIDGRWWLVDPEGHLFLSNGVTTVTSVVRTDANGAYALKTGIDGRENFFAEVPAPGTPARSLGLVAAETATVTSGDYQGRRPLAANFFALNALKQFSGATSVEDLRTLTGELAFERLRSWGFTTIGGWSDADLFTREGRIPYTNVLQPTHPGLINGSIVFLDYFHDAWMANLRARLAQEVGTTIGDSFNLGYYIDNERDWTKSNVSARDLGLTVLAAPAEAVEHYAKRAFRDQLQAKYGAIAALNSQWGTDYADWDAFLTRRDVAPEAAASADDMSAFEALYAETYFSACRTAMREYAPQHLYLGCRFTTGGREALVRVAARYADVVTVNIYGSSVRLLSGLDADVPVLSTEFHFSSRDSGLLADPVASSVVRTSQSERAASMRSYLENANANARFVGAHWFQYFDYPPSGRLNSRNMNSNLGLVAVTNLPYTDMIAAARIANFAACRTRWSPPSREPEADAGAMALTPSGSYGADTTLAVGEGQESYLRFDFSDVSSPVERAILVLTPVSGDGLARHALLAVPDATWSEAGLNWNNRPATGATIASWSTLPGLAAEIDVTREMRRALTTDRRLAFGLKSLDGSMLHYGSREGDAASRPRLLLLTGPATLVEWRARYFIDPVSPAAADAADPDADGAPNLLEYALARAPHEAETVPGWQVTRDAEGRATFNFYRARGDVNYIVESSTDLIEWKLLAINPGVIGGTATVVDPEANSPRRFMRLRIEKP